MRVDGTLKDLSAPVDARRHGSPSSPASQPEALELLRHDAAHVLAEAVKELYPDAQVTFGPATETGFYYDFARDDAVHARGSREASRRACARSCSATSRSPARCGRATRPSPTSSRSARPTRRSGSARSRPDEEICDLPPGQVRRSLRRPASALDRQARPGLQADEGRRRLLARRRQERAAAAHLRHRLGEQEGARPVPLPARGGGEARPSPARPRAGPLPPAGRGGRQRLLAPQGLDAVAHPRDLYAPPPRRRRLLGGQDAAAARPRACGRPRAIGRSSARTCSSPQSARRDACWR